MKLFIRMSDDGLRVDSVYTKTTLTAEEVVVIAPDEIYNVEVFTNHAIVDAVERVVGDDDATRL